MSKRSIHLICNAHLDPVWLWEWEEGAAEAISTFRVAAELCEKHKTFIFNHNEATLYKWVEEFEPELFARIRRLVKSGRWHIMGGWYLQPDCNMPSGESIVRQIMLGREYFREKFGVEPKTAINFDPFGHSRGLVQILAKSGYDSYLFGRPRVHELKLPGEDFNWIGFDGSKVLATRFGGWYNSPLGKAREIISERITSSPQREIFALLWGVGNHGGGPSKKDLVEVNELIKDWDHHDIRHSTPDEYFRQLHTIGHKLPSHEKNINPWGTGCYTTMIRVKQKHRLLENELYALEKMASSASFQGLMNYPRNEINHAVEKLAESEFHDILPGSAVETVEESSLRLIEHARELVARLRAKAFFRLAQGQKKAAEGEIPVMIYNPHPFAVSGCFEVEFNLPDYKPKDEFADIKVYQDGKTVPSQVEQELSNLPLEWRKRVVFCAKLKPSQMNRFDCRIEILSKKPAAALQPEKDVIKFKTDQLEVAINTRTGLMDRYRVNGKELLKKGSFEPIVIEDDSDSWGAQAVAFKNIIGKFQLMSPEQGSHFSGVNNGKIIPSVRVIEDGPARTVVESVLYYNHSHICQKYKLPKHGTQVEIDTRVYWNEKDKMLKLAIPTVFKKCSYIGQVAYGTEELPSTGDEAVAQKWVAAVSKEQGLAITCINDGVYGSSIEKDEIRLTLLRSPAYSAYPNMRKDKPEVEMPADRYSPRIDQGLRVYRFWINGGPIEDQLESVDRQALVKNEKPFALSFFPSGAGTIPKPFAVITGKTVQLTAMKQAQKANELIVRLFEPTGKPRNITLKLPALGMETKIKMGRFEIKTLKINPKTRKITRVDLLERPVKK